MLLMAGVLGKDTMIPSFIKEKGGKTYFESRVAVRLEADELVASLLYGFKVIQRSNHSGNQGK